MYLKSLFTSSFLSHFTFLKEHVYFNDSEIFSLENKLNIFEQIVLNPEIEKGLITKNEMLTSFAISKAENSSLTLKEAEDLHKLILSDTNFNFLKLKVQNSKKLTQKDHDKLEFFNIVKTYRKITSEVFDINNLDISYIKNIHKNLTYGLDIFANILLGFDIYNSGKLRNTDEIRVGEYAPPSYKVIEENINELIEYLKKNPTPTAVSVFHTALYAIHPFSNGNKRVCRILEHILLKHVGLNSKNLYSTSYYYHKEKDRYYKHLLYSLERKNLNYFVNFVQEAIVLSLVSVVKTSLEAKRQNYLSNLNLERNVKSILKPLIKRKEIQFKNLFKQSRRKVSRQTFVTYLKNCTNLKIITRRSVGKNSFYRLNVSFQEEIILKEQIGFVSKRLKYIPDSIKIF